MASQSMINQVQSMYIAYYGRPADPAGLSYWAGRLEAEGGNLDAIVDAFGTSAEYQDRFGGLDDATMVAAFYEQIFNREPDPLGLAFYTSELAAGRMTLATVAKRIWDGALGDDVLIVGNKLAAADFFTTRVSDLNKVYDAGAIEPASEILASVGASDAQLVHAVGEIEGLVAAMASLPNPVVILPLSDVVIEGGTASLTVMVSDHSSHIEVSFRTVEGTAQHGSDFVAAQGHLVFAPGETVKTLVVQALSDSVTEGIERFQVVFDRPWNAEFAGGGSSADVSIDLLDTTIAGGTAPTAYEQLMLELINRARLDPAGEAARYATPLNEGLPAGTLTDEPRQPVAFHPDLIAAARGHSQWMLDNDLFQHAGEGGSRPADRVATEGYDWITVGENLAWSGTTGPISDIGATVEGLHEALYIDSGVAGRGHRKILLDDDFREVGVGVLAGSFNQYNAVMVTNDYAARPNASAMLTGVIYEDEDGNGFYTPGEGLGGVAILARGAGEDYTAVAMTSGGYQMELPDGDYSVGFFAPDGLEMFAQVSIDGVNEKLDWIL